jgi:hypothetical protein
MSDTIKKNLAKFTSFLKTPASEIFNRHSLNRNFRRSNSSSFQQGTHLLKWNLEPAQVANFFRSFFILVTLVILLCLTLIWFQYPSSQSGRPEMTYYETGLKNDPSHLFSKKMIQLDGIKIQGIMITKDLPINPQGYVVFDIDGKNVGPIEVGETFGKGLFLQAITNNSATITYQGQKSTIYLNSVDNSSTEKK